MFYGVRNFLAKFDIMTHYIGILFAFIALISWGFGDFFIQKTTRIIGSWKALFFIGIVGRSKTDKFLAQKNYHLDF